jgi:CDP-diacylglycerol--glycerol-3-phosphate 3-phosphatidyltransferase/cardiolipin synthase
MRGRSMLTLPNMLSLSRIALAAAFPLVREAKWQATLVVAAGATDFLDGFIARARQADNKWGALLDPITDRVFVFTAFVTYLLVGQLTTSQYFILLARDLATAIGFLVARLIPWLRGVTFKARLTGKLVTTLQLIVLIAVPLAPSAVRPLVVVVGVLSVWSIIDYTLALWRARVPA